MPSFRVSLAEMKGFAMSSRLNSERIGPGEEEDARQTTVPLFVVIEEAAGEADALLTVRAACCRRILSCWAPTREMTAGARGTETRVCMVSRGNRVDTRAKRRRGRECPRPQCVRFLGGKVTEPAVISGRLKRWPKNSIHLGAPRLTHTSRRASAHRHATETMSDDAAPDTGAAKTPADFLKSIRGKPVVVKLNSGVDYRGILACLDGYMNIAMEQTEVRSSSRSRAMRSTRASRSNDASTASSGRARAPIADAPPNPKLSRHSCVQSTPRSRLPPDLTPHRTRR